MILLLIFWVVCGCAATQLIHTLSIVHEDDDELNKYEPHNVWITVGWGPILLLIFLGIAIGYATEGKQ